MTVDYPIGPPTHKCQGSFENGDRSVDGAAWFTNCPNMATAMRAIPRGDESWAIWIHLCASHAELLDSEQEAMRS